MKLDNVIKRLDSIVEGKVSTVSAVGDELTLDNLIVEISKSIQDGANLLLLTGSNKFKINSKSIKINRDFVNLLKQLMDYGVKQKDIEEYIRKALSDTNQYLNQFLLINLTALRNKAKR